MASIAEGVPGQDPVARFMVTVSMARNDVRHALFEAGGANAAGKPDFAYWVRLSTAHFFEAVSAIRSWRQVPEVKAFLTRLPAAAWQSGSEGSDQKPRGDR